MSKLFIKKCISAVISVSLLLPSVISAAADETPEVKCVFDLNNTSLETGSTNIPNTTQKIGSFTVGEVPAEISSSGKGIFANTEEAQIYFNTNEPINTVNVSESTDYVVRVKFKVAPSDFLDSMQLRLGFMNSSTSKRLGFIGFIGNVLSYASASPEVGEWYNFIIRIHPADADTEATIMEKLYPVNEAEPEEWDLVSKGNFVSMHYDMSQIADLIGIKGWKQEDFGFTDYSVYSYNAAAISLYDEMNKSLSELYASINHGEVMLDDAISFKNEFIPKTEEVKGNVHDILLESVTPLLKKIEQASEIEEKISELLKIEINDSNLFELYDRAESIKSEAEEIVFADVKENIKAAADNYIESMLAPRYSLLTSYDGMEYTDAEAMKNTAADTENGWSGGWETNASISRQDGLLINGTVQREFESAMDYNYSCDYTMQLKNVKLCGNGFDAHAGNIPFGAKYIDGKYYPYAGDVIGKNEIAAEKAHNYLLRISASEPRKVTLVVYGDERKSAETPDVQLSFYENGGNLFSIESDGSIFGSISKEVYPSKYAETAETSLKDIIGNTTAENISLAEEKFNSAAAEIAALRDGSVKEYLNTVADAAQDCILSVKLDSLFKSLDEKITVTDINEAEKLIRSLSDQSTKAAYEEKLAPYAETARKSTPVISSVGIDGEIKVSNMVSANVQFNDFVGNGDGYNIEWLVNGSVKGTDKTFYISNDYARCRLSLRVTAKNTNGILGEPVSTNPVTIAGMKTTGGGGGGSSSGGRSTASGSPVLQGGTSQENIPSQGDNLFKDTYGHWAENSINDMVRRGIANGVDSTYFDPDRNITRAEFTKLLVSAVGITPVTYNNCFADINGDEWYAPYIAAAKEKSIIEGNGESFDADGNITREQAAVMLVRVYKKYYPNTKRANSEVFEDYKEISEWAVSGVETALDIGLINGVSETLLLPGKNATRAEAVVMLQRLIQTLGF